MADLFDIVVAKKLAGSSGGGDISVEPLSVTENDTYIAPPGKAYSPITVNVSGGSSDFSTAEVTVNSSTQYGYALQLSRYYDYDNNGIIVPAILKGDIGTSITLDTVLYKGQAMCILRPTGQNTPNVSVSGNIQDVGQQTYIITGDCTITIS